MRVGVVPADKAACGIIRLRWPAEELQRRGHNVEILDGIEGAWEPGKWDHIVDIRGDLDFDLIVFQRVYKAEIVEVIQLLRKRGVKIAIDIDDDLLALGSEHPIYGRMTEYWQELSRAGRCVDLITVSTPALAKRYGGFAPVRIVPNGIPKAYLDISRTQTYHKPVVGWTGTVHTHPGDLEMVGSAIADLCGPGGPAKFRGIGDPTICDALGVPRPIGQYQQGIMLDDDFGYARLYANLDIAIVPLKQSRFNAGKCVDYSMRICTLRGLVPAGELIPGDWVWHRDWRLVQAVERGPARAGIEVETAGGYQLRLTPNHRMLVNGDWKVAQDIVVGDTMTMESEVIGPKDLVRLPWPADGRMSRPHLNVDHSAFLTAIDGPRVDLSVRWARFLGAFVGDGSVGQKTSIQISCDGQDADWIELLMSDFQAMGFVPHTEQIVTFDGIPIRRRALRVSSAHLLRVLSSLGLTSERPSGRPIRRTCIPDAIWRSPLPVVAEFLAGYFEADGTCDKSSVSVTSKDEMLIRDVQRLLVAFGILSRVHSRTHRNQTGYSGLFWHLTLTRAATDLFAAQIGFRSARKQARLAIITGRAHSNAYQPPNPTPTVVAVRSCTLDPVDIQVEGEVFSAAGFVSHNSWLKGLEAASVGVPFIASPTPEYVRLHELGAGLLAETPKEWKHQLARLIADVDLQAEMSVRGRAVAATLTSEAMQAPLLWSAWEAAVAMPHRTEPYPAAPHAALAGRTAPDHA